MLCRAGIRLEARPAFRNQKRFVRTAFGQQHEIGATFGYGCHLFGLRVGESRHWKPLLRPFLASGAGTKEYMVADLEPFPQAIPQSASLLRAEFRDN
jgi:hypothetical protein